MAIKTAFILQSNDQFSSRLVIGTADKMVTKGSLHVALFHSQQVVLYENRHERKYSGYLVRTGQEGHSKIPGVYPHVNILVSTKTVQKIRTLSTILKHLIGIGYALETINDGVYTRLNS